MLIYRGFHLSFFWKSSFSGSRNFAVLSGEHRGTVLRRNMIKFLCLSLRVLMLWLFWCGCGGGRCCCGCGAVAAGAGAAAAGPWRWPAAVAVDLAGVVAGAAAAAVVVIVVVVVVVVVVMVMVVMLLVLLAVARGGGGGRYCRYTIMFVWLDLNVYKDGVGAEFPALHLNPGSLSPSPKPKISHNAKFHTVDCG